MTARLAQAAGVQLAEDRLDLVAEALAALLALAASLSELRLEEVEPAPTIPDWR